MLLHDIVTLAALDRPAATAVVAGDRRLSFAQLDRRIRDLRDLVAEVTSPGDRVVVLAENSLDLLCSLYAIPAAGALATLANTRHLASEIGQLLTSSAPTLMIVGAQHVERIAATATRHCPGVELWSIDGAHEAAGRDLSAALDDAATQPGASAATGAQDQQALDADSPAWLIHTSGSTGAPKGVLLSHRSLVAAVANTAIARPLRDDDVYLFPFPLFHVAAYNVLHAHLRRCAVVLMARFDATEMLELVPRESVTTCSLAPTMLSMLLDHPQRRAGVLDGLRQISYGASSMPLDLLRRAHTELPQCGLAQGYGMTELSGNAVFLSPDDHRRAVEGRPELLAAAGRPGPLVAVRIVDEHGRDVAAGASGEIVVRGDQVCLGYRDAPATTAATIVEGWLHTGDVGRIDEHGYLYVVDRKKDLVITGGENVASREVEDVLGTHPEVRMVAVVGRPDLRWGELVTAVVVREPGARLDAETLIEWTRGRLAGFKRPRHVEFVEQLPLNASSKVDKVALRALVAQDDPSAEAS